MRSFFDKSSTIVILEYLFRVIFEQKRLHLLVVSKVTISFFIYCKISVN